MSERPPISPRSPRAALEPEQVPPPPKRSERARNPFVVVGNAIITILLIAMLGAGSAYYYGKRKLEAPGPLQEDKVVNIPPRAGMTDIAEILQREGVIDNNRWAFIGSVFALKARSGLKPGEYQFQKNASLHEVIGTMVDGKVVQHAVTIPEGLTSEQIVARLSDNDIFAGTVHEIPREGTLLPETYKFPRGTTRDQVIARMQQAQKRVVAEIWEHRSADIPVKTPEQLVTLASIVEKETGKADERSRVAAVYVNRLRQKMKLQSDPTIIYGLVGGKGRWGGRSNAAKSCSRRHTIPMWSTAFRPARSPIPAAPRWRPQPIRPARAICSSLLTAPAATPLPKPTISIRRTSPNCGRWKSRSRTTRRSLPTIRHHSRRAPPAPQARPLPRQDRRQRSRRRRKGPPTRRRLARAPRNRPRRLRPFSNSGIARRLAGTEFRFG